MYYYLRLMNTGLHKGAGHEIAASQRPLHSLEGREQYLRSTIMASFVLRNPALAPLFVAVGAGVFGGTWYGYHTLKHNQDIIIDKIAKPEPWQHIRQDQQTKLYTPRENAGFWASRQGLPQPHTVYAGESGSTLASAKQKVKEIKAARAAEH